MWVGSLIIQIKVCLLFMHILPETIERPEKFGARGFGFFIHINLKIKIWNCTSTKCQQLLQMHQEKDQIQREQKVAHRRRCIHST